MAMGVGVGTYLSSRAGECGFFFRSWGLSGCHEYNRNTSIFSSLSREYSHVLVPLDVFFNAHQAFSVANGFNLVKL